MARNALIVFVLAGFLLPHLAEGEARQGRPAWAASAATVKVAAQTKTRNVKNGAMFPVTTKIRNISNEVLTLHIWTCAYGEHWRTDSPSLGSAPYDCTRNFIQNVDLKSGEVYKRDAYFQVRLVPEDLAKTSITFRVGFADDGQNVPSQPVWSNPITIKITGQSKTK